MIETTKNGYVTYKVFFSTLGAVLAFSITVLLSLLGLFSSNINSDLDKHMIIVDERLDRMSLDIDHIQREMYSRQEIVEEFRRMFEEMEDSEQSK